MKTKNIVITGIVLALTIAALIRITAALKRQQEVPRQPVAALEEKERRGRINFKERVQLAKAKGKEKLVVPGVVTNYSLDMPADPDAANQALLDYTVVIARVTEKKSYLADESRIGTWNKFKVVDTISRAQPRQSSGEWPAIPDELLPAGEDEVFVHTAGGTVTVDGVEVVQNDVSLPAFDEGQKYLLVLSLDPATRIGEIGLGLYGTLPINQDDTLDARNNQRYLQQVIKTHHDGSVERLKNNIRSRSRSH